jgi:hypothetical protein
MKPALSKLAIPPDLQPLSKGNKMRRIFAGLAMASLILFGIPAVGHAQAPPQCGQSNINYTGNVVLTPPQGSNDCSVGGFIVATGSVQISAPNGSVTVGASIQPGTFLEITAKNNISVGSFIASTDSVILNATSGNITTTSIQTSAADGYVQMQAQKITATNISTMNASVSLLSQGDIQTGAILTNGGGVQFHANYQTAVGSASDQLVTNTGAPNGPTSINTSGPTSGGIYLTNGGNGGIVITNSNDIGTYSSSGAGGMIIVDACNEQDTNSSCTASITLPSSGFIASDGGSTGSAGSQLYIAKSVIVPGALQLTSDDTLAGAHPEHYVVISTAALTLNGNLSIYANGGEPASPALNAASQINNFGADTASDGFAPFGTITITLTTSPPSSGLSITGSGNLTISATGANPQIGLQGMPLNYSAGALAIYTYDQGAVVEFLSPSGSPINLTTAQTVGVYAYGPTGGNGGGGTINFYPGTMGTITPNVQLYALGTGTGLSGHVNLTPGAGNISLGSNVGSFLIAANGGNTNQCKTPLLPNANVATPGTITFDSSNQAPNVSANMGSANQGGCLNLDAASIVSNDPVSIYATGDGNGGGGSITIDVPSFALSQYYLSATAGPAAGGTGAGGTVTIPSAITTTALNINSVVIVDAGKAAPLATQDGTIALNGVTCGQWKIGVGAPNNAWPLTYWDCANPTAPTQNESNVGVKVSLLPATFKNTLGGQKVNLYVMNKASDFDLFFQPDPSIGNVYGAEITSLNLAVVFDKILNGADVSLYAKGDMMHELAHLIDAYTNFPSQNNKTFTAASKSDQTYLAGQTCMKIVSVRSIV